MDEKIIIEALTKIPKIESWLADKAYRPDSPPADRTAHPESYERGVSDTFLYLRKLIIDNKKGYADFRVDR